MAAAEGAPAPLDQPLFGGVQERATAAAQDAAVKTLAQEGKAAAGGLFAGVKKTMGSIFAAPEAEKDHKDADASASSATEVVQGGGGEAVQEKIASGFVNAGKQVNMVMLQLVQQGPQFLQLLGVACSIAAMVHAVHHTCKSKNSKIMNICMDLYRCVFALMTVVYEFPQDLVEALKPLVSIRDLLIEYVNFLSKCLGRGLFYIFQASLVITLYDAHLVLSIAISVFICVVGVANVWLHWNKDTVPWFQMREHNKIVSTEQHADIIASRLPKKKAQKE